MPGQKEKTTMVKKTTGLIIILLCFSLMAPAVPAWPHRRLNQRRGTSGQPGTRRLRRRTGRRQFHLTRRCGHRRKELVTFTIWGVTPDLMCLVPLTEADHPEDRPYQAIEALTAWPDQSRATVSPWPEVPRSSWFKGSKTVQPQ